MGNRGLTCTATSKAMGFYIREDAHESVLQASVNLAGEYWGSLKK